MDLRKKEDIERDFFNYHDALFLQFLHVNNFFKWSEKEGRVVEDGDIRRKLYSCIGQRGAVLLEATIYETETFRKGGINEVPSFHFNFQSKEVISDFTKEKIKVYRGQDWRKEIKVGKKYNNIKDVEDIWKEI